MRMLSRPSSYWTWYLREIRSELAGNRKDQADTLCFNVGVVDVLVVVGDAVNFKITDPTDLAVARALLPTLPS